MTQTLVGAFSPSFLGQFELGPQGREADATGQSECAAGEGRSRGSPGPRDGQGLGSRGCGRQASLAWSSIRSQPPCLPPGAANIHLPLVRPARRSLPLVALLSAFLSDSSLVKTSLHRNW